VKKTALDFYIQMISGLSCFVIKM